MRGYVLLWAALSAVALVPFLLTPLPPLNDYPSHLARAYIISAWPGSADLQRYYAVEFSLIPNLAVDFAVPALSKVLPVETSMALFTAFSMLLLSSGALAVSWSLFGRLSPAPFASFLIFYNRQLLWGFVGYLFTLGAALWVFAFWVHSEGRIGPKPRIVLFALLAFVLFVGHLHAFATYAVLVAGYEIAVAFTRDRDRPGRMRRLTVAALQFVPPTLAFLLLSPTRNRAAEIEYGGLVTKITGVLDAFHTYNKPLDALTLILLVALVIGGFVSRKLVFHRLMIPAVAALAALYTILPTTIMGSFAADRRLATSIYFIAAASAFWRFSGSRTSRAAAAAILALFLWRTAVVADHWRDAGRFYSDLLSATERLPKGTRLATAVAKPGSPFLEDPPVMFFASMAVVRRQAFVNSLFADEGHQPLKLRYRPADVRSGRLPHIFPTMSPGTGREPRAGNPFVRIRADEYDYFLLLNTRYFSFEVPGHLTPVAQRPGVYSLYRRSAVTAGGEASSAGSNEVPAR